MFFGDYVWAGFDDPTGRRPGNGSAKPEKPEKPKKNNAFSGFCITTDLKNLKKHKRILLF